MINLTTNRNSQVFLEIDVKYWGVTIKYKHVLLTTTKLAGWTDRLKV